MKYRYMLAFVGVFAASCGAQAGPRPEAVVEGGKLAGRVENGVASWKGIPFAAPPVGPLRWRAPQPAAAWQGTREATTYGHDCMQKPFDGDAAPLGTPPAEDCLYANVWRPAAAKGKLPVVVWIYGGGFVNGGASPPTYSGAELARQGVLFFSFNYRIGRFGTFAHPALTRAAEDGGMVGNYGYMDQLAALRWVQRNIAAFGGDPANVTIIGESAGGMSVNNLVTSPEADGLFHKAVVMSGGNGTSLANPDLAAAEEIGGRFGQSKDIAPGDPEALAKLRGLTAEQVIDGLNLAALFTPPGGLRTFASPFSDGRIAVDQRKAYETNRFHRVPMMIGATSDDIGGVSGGMVAGARQISDLVAKAGVPVYEYRFSYVASSLEGGGKGAGHATDIPFFLDTQAVKYGDRTSARDKAMGGIVSAYLVNFARTGDPNGASLPKWSPRAGEGGNLLDFAADGTARFERDPWIEQIHAAPVKTGL
ncbi:para-nitrobenzyl esterase [Novosphingobium sp. PhB55]|uniref:carboxylesterase/lipase family protein n=1 Tax=Novosphingobium sp. PhB55 TaxID=2485106 RepID=UPI001064C476|nr:carboxylesterase family protein [Novosphingobium sp. PhB55]TDW62933.1 para-nitrobenzyl esterase [Novosphingobium sp. PhB55]